MNIRFVASDPRQHAAPILDQLLAFGTDQLAISCAFLTGGGVELLQPHVDRLRLAPSFVVTAWAEPTSLPAVGDLHALAPGHVYLHLGSLTPVEKGVGPGLMHTKVFFARNGSQCRLWTGSHNLTASAMQGVNCEAAILLEGAADEPIFRDALYHLNQCRTEALLFDPLAPPPDLRPQQTLVIHAECHTALSTPPWHIHLRPETTDYDRAMRPPAAVWLYLYDRGTLRLGESRPLARAAYSGELTALNFTEDHPRHEGIPAQWPQEDFIIQVERGVPRLTMPEPHHTTPSQGIINIRASEDPRTVWTSENPEPKLERVVGVRRVAPVDPRFTRFFTKQSLDKDGGGLLHQEYRSVEKKVRRSLKEFGADTGQNTLFRPNSDESFEVEYTKDLRSNDKFAFIYRAKFKA